MAKLPPPPHFEEIASSRIPTKREFQAKFPTAKYSGKNATWILKTIDDLTRYLKIKDAVNPKIKGKRTWEVECPSAPLI